MERCPRCNWSGPAGTRACPRCGEVLGASPPASQPAARPTLVLKVTAELAPEEWEIAGAETSIGRLDSDVTLPHRSVSRNHARIMPTSTGYTIEDVGSTNGTWLNDRPVQDRELLSNGDSLLIGDVPLSVTLLQPRVAPNTRPVVYDVGPSPSVAASPAPLAAPGPPPVAPSGAGPSTVYYDLDAAVAAAGSSAPPPAAARPTPPPAPPPTPNAPAAPWETPRAPAAPPASNAPAAPWETPRAAPPRTAANAPSPAWETPRAANLSTASEPPLAPWETPTAPAPAAWETPRAASPSNAPSAPPSDLPWTSGPATPPPGYNARAAPAPPPPAWEAPRPAPPPAVDHPVPHAWDDTPSTRVDLPRAAEDTDEHATLVADVPIEAIEPIEAIDARPPAPAPAPAATPGTVSAAGMVELADQLAAAVRMLKGDTALGVWLFNYGGGAPAAQAFVAQARRLATDPDNPRERDALLEMAPTAARLLEAATLLVNVLSSLEPVGGVEHQTQPDATDLQPVAGL